MKKRTFWDYIVGWGYIIFLVVISIVAGIIVGVMMLVFVIAYTFWCLLERFVLSLIPGIGKTEEKNIPEETFYKDVFLAGNCLYLRQSLLKKILVPLKKLSFVIFVSGKEGICMDGDFCSHFSMERELKCLPFDKVYHMAKSGKKVSKKKFLSYLRGFTSSVGLFETWFPYVYNEGLMIGKCY